MLACLDVSWGRFEGSATYGPEHDHAAALPDTDRTLSLTRYKQNTFDNPPTVTEIRIIEELYAIGEGAPPIRAQVLAFRMSLDVADELETRRIYDASQVMCSRLSVLVPLSPSSPRSLFLPLPLPLPLYLCVCLSAWQFACLCTCLCLSGSSVCLFLSLSPLFSRPVRHDVVTPHVSALRLVLFASIDCA